MDKYRYPRLLKQKRRFDYITLLLALFFSLFGLLMIFEASNVGAFRDFGDKYHYVKEQLIWLVVGLIGCGVFSLIPYKKLRLIALPLFISSFFLLLMVFIPGIGIKLLGARRWIGFGSFTFQPSELAKISIILYLSSWFTTYEKRRFLAFLLIMLMIVGLVVLQPDLGTAVILVSVMTVIYFLSNAPLWNFIFLIPLVVSGIIFLSLIAPYRFQRLMTFLNPNLDPLGASYHIRQILISFGAGGFWGVGLGNSRQKYQFLPEATTDSIFAIIGEELGFIGAVTFIILFCIFLFRIYRIVSRAPDKQSFLLGAGVLALIAIQTLINLGSMTAVFPLTGVPLPFISYGGSSLVVTLLAVGMILNISRYT